MKKLKRIAAALMSAALACSALTINAGAQETGKHKAVISVEAFTIGCGYVLEPTEVEFNEGDTVDKLFTKALDDNNIAYEASTSSGFYLESIDFPHTENIPSYITDKVISHDEETGEDMLFGEEIDEDYSPESLGQSDYTYFSGWMYTVNAPTAESLSLAMSQYEVHDDDVIRIQFSLDCGSEIGIANLMGMPIYGFHSDFYPVADKTELTRAIARANASENSPQLNALNKMKRTAANLPAAQDEVNGAVNTFNELVRRDIKRGDVNLDGTLSIADAILIQKNIVNMIKFNDIEACVADAGCDENISVADAITVQKIITGIIAS